ncbi:hypothetical protein mRhiFer1_009671 [Rhinolophus ferrumequinum]|uniref:Reverse transcriptase domain-containing protein n=1 Tax=Rhinolophus ferrumequinum TaxID=59479 RepID=A0A7J7R386_RHIFE|nr:hypothetical protein mRhiFer1_009671 [Rhinolophus ferrumequinum]
MSKTADVTQNREETPGDFYEHLCEALRVYTPFDPEAPENQRMINVAFVAQTTPDIRRKLQKLEGFSGMNMTQLLEVANKVYRNREVVAKRETDKRMREKVTLRSCSPTRRAWAWKKRASRWQTGPYLRAPIKEDQCAYCKELGHWKNECRSQTVTFKVDTGAEHSVVTMLVAPLGDCRVTITGATGDQAKSPPFCQARTCKLGGHTLSHEIPYLPDCPIPLLGRDLLTKLGAQISFELSVQAILSMQPPSEGFILSITTPREEEWRLYGTGSVEQNPEAYRADFPEVWAEDNPPGLAKHKAPVLVELRPGAQPQRLLQYPISREARAGIQKHLARLRAAGILIECQSPWNTPLLPVRKPNGECRPVQDLRAVNQATVSLHPVVPNPYTLLSQLPPEAGGFTCLDLKDTFFCIRLASQSQSLFAFKWTDPDTGRQPQLTWTRLPQGFKNSPTLFGEVLASDLATFRREEYRCPLLQYVDDLLLACATETKCQTVRWALLSHLAETGYRVSWKKAQLCRKQV